MRKVLPLLYGSEFGDFYAPVEHYTFAQAIEELCDDMGWDESESATRYSGIMPIPLHEHSLDGDEIYECPNYNDEVGDEPEPCIGYVDCHVFE